MPPGRSIAPERRVRSKKTLTALRSFLRFLTSRALLRGALLGAIAESGRGQPPQSWPCELGGKHDFQRLLLGLRPQLRMLGGWAADTRILTVGGGWGGTTPQAKGGPGGRSDDIGLAAR